MKRLREKLRSLALTRYPGAEIYVDADPQNDLTGALGWNGDQLEQSLGSVVDSKDVLSDKVFMYDRESNRLFEPKTPERSASERGER